jgi:beta-glucosidase
LKDLHKTGKPVVYVNFSGSAMALNWEDENLSAIVQAFYPGEATGTALSRLLFGDFNPYGRLPVTFYKSEKDITDFSNYDMQGRTYRYFTGTPLYPFGYGLSYTSYEYSNLTVDKSSDTQSDVEVSVEVINTGKTGGEEVVQVYVSNKTAKTIVPLTSLKGFKRVYLKPGEKKIVSFILKPEDFSVTNTDAQQVVEPGVFDIAVGGAVPDENAQIKTIEITGKIFEIE